MFASACLWIGGLTTVPTAQAEPAQESGGARAAVLPLLESGDALPDADRQMLTQELVEGLRRGEFDVIGPDEVAAASPGSEKCEEASCYQEIANATNATHLVRARVQVADRDYRVDVVLIDGRSGTSLATTEESCEICGIADAGNMISTAAATLRNKLDALAKGPSMLNVVSNPEGATVTIDGEIAGTTPLERPTVPGKRVIRISKEGYITLEREVTLVEGMQEQLSFELEKVPSRLPSRPWGWVSLGVGVAGIGTAVAFSVLDDNQFKFGSACKGSRVDADGDCERLWSTEYIVLGTALAGAALTTLGIAVLLTTARRDKAGKGGKKAKKSPKKATARFGVGPGSVTVLGRF